MSERVIYVLGADFSGTTMLDLMLGGHSQIASAGELSAMIEPTMKSHLSPICSCHDECMLWSDRSSFSNDPYKPLFDFHGVSTIVDSSKHPEWVMRQAKQSKLNGREIYCLLIWKSPDQYAVSCAKRGNPNRWVQKWLSYYQSVLQSGLLLHTVSLQALMDDSRVVLSDICLALDLDFEHSMLEWHAQRHHIVFGSATARRAIHKAGTQAHDIENALSIRSDIRGTDFIAPRMPNLDEQEKLQHLQSVLENNQSHSAVKISGKFAFVSICFRKKIERLLFFFRVDVAFIRRVLRSMGL